MVKAQKEEIIKSINRKSTKKLQQSKETLRSWEWNHRKKINSWFWDDNGNASMRRGKEKYYTFSANIELGVATISYWSDCTMSRKHVYWKDGLSCEINGDSVPINFGDVNLFISEIDKILDKR